VPGVPNISKVLARVLVSDLDAAVPLYEEFAQARAEKFGFRDMELARVGPFLLLAGNTAAYRPAPRRRDSYRVPLQFLGLASLPPSPA
jgi:hypothetical protein